MKQFFFTLPFLFLTTAWAGAQQNDLTAFIDKYKDEKGFTHAFLSKDLFEVATQAKIAGTDWKKLHHVIQNLGSLSLLAADSIRNGLDLYQEARTLVGTDFDELLAVRDGQDNVRVWAKAEDALITDLVLLVGTADEFVLVCFAGQLELSNLAELPRLFDAASVEQLARTAEKVAIDFKISPNPSNGEFTLSYTTTEHDLPAFLNIMDQSGRQLASLNLAETTSQRIKLPDLPAGLYWVQFKTQQGKVGVKQIQIVH